MVHSLIDTFTCGNVGSQNRNQGARKAPAAQGFAEKSQTRLKSDPMAPGADYRTFCLALVTNAQLARPCRGKMCVIKSGRAGWGVDWATGTWREDCLAEKSYTNDPQSAHDDVIWQFV